MSHMRQNMFDHGGMTSRVPAVIRIWSVDCFEEFLRLLLIKVGCHYLER